MSQTLQNQITYAKSMNGIVTLSDGMGTTIQNGQVVTLDLCGNTVTAGTANIGTLTLNDIDLNGSLTIEAINDIPYSRGNVSLWNKGNTWLANPVSITGDLYTSGQNIFDGSFQAITINNGNFMNPVLPGGTSVQNILLAQTNTTPNFSAYVGWGFFSETAKNYNIKIQKGTGGTFYFTYFPGATNQALILQTNGVSLGSVSAQTQTYTLTPGIYTFAFYIQHNSWCVDSRIFAYVYTLAGSLLTSLSNLNVAGQYPNWVQYKMNFTLTTTTDVYFIIKETTINFATSEYVAVYGCTLQQTEISIFKDNNLTSGIGGSSSVLNNLIVNNSASITGGATIAGGLTVGSTLGLNNTPINSTMNNANNSYNIAIGNGVLNGLTNGQRNTVVGDSACSLNVTTTSDLTVMGYSTYILNNESRSTYVGSGISSRSVNGMNSCVGYGIGGTTTNGDMGQENAIIGYNNLQLYNGFGSYSPSQNAIVGALSCYQLGDSYNSAVGYKTFNIMTHTAGVNSTRYNTAIGAFAGDSYYLYNYCTLLGANTDTNASGLVRATAVGANTIVSSSYTIQLGSNKEDVRMSGNVYMPRQIPLLQTALGDINIQSALTPITFDDQYNFNVWDKQATGQIFIIDTSNNNVTVNTQSSYWSTFTTTEFQSPQISFLSADISLNGATTINDNFTVNGLSSSLVNCLVNGTLTLTPDANGYTIIADTVGTMMKINSATTFSCAFGYNTLANETSTASNNSCFGSTALNQLTTGSNNTACGAECLTTITTQSQNTAVGSLALRSATSGDSVGIGYSAGSNQTTGSQNVFIGSGANFPSTLNQYTNSVCIGYNSRITADNTIFLGTASQNVSVFGNIVFQNGGGGVQSVNNPARNAMTFSTAGSLQITGVGALYCSVSPRVKAQYYNTSSFYSASFTMPSVFPEIICIAPPATTVVATFPTLTSAYDGLRITFRRVSTTNATTQVTSSVANIYNLSGVSGNGILASNQYVQTIMCGQLTAGTYAWFYV